METRIVSASTLSDRIAVRGGASTRVFGRRILGLLVLVALSGALPFHAWADETPVLHEYVPAVSDDELSVWETPEGTPSAIVYDDEGEDHVLHRQFVEGAALGVEVVENAKDFLA